MNAQSLFRYRAEWFDGARASAGLIDKAEAFCAERNLSPNTLIEAGIAEDMLPFAYQVKSMAVHPLGAIEGVRTGVFAPDTPPPPSDFAGLKMRLTEALADLEPIDPAELDGFPGRDMRFEFGERRMESWRRNSCSRSRISTSMPPPRPTSSAGGDCRSASATSRECHA